MISSPRNAYLSAVQLLKDLGPGRTEVLPDSKGHPYYAVMTFHSQKSLEEC